MGIAPKDPKHPAWSFGTIPGQPATTPKLGVAERKPVTDEDKLKRLISTNFGIDENDITPNANFFDDLEMDSLDLVELSMAVEEEFAFEWNEDEDECMLVTIKQWMAAINKQRGTKQ